MAALPKDRRLRWLLRVAFVLGLFLLGRYAAVPLVREFQNADARIAVKEKQLAKYRRAVAEGKALGPRLKSLEQLLGKVEAGLLTAETPALAAVDIQQVLNDIAKSAGVEIKTVRVLAPKKLEREDYLGVPVQFTLDTGIGQLKQILYKIGTSTKYLTVDKLRITVARSRRISEIRSDITVMGYMKKTL